jgi:hypothetical protein
MSASTPRGAWVISRRNSDLRLRLACEWVRSRAPPTTHRRGKTRAACGVWMRPVRTAHSKKAKPTTRSTEIRCCRTSG